MLPFWTVSDVKTCQKTLFPLYCSPVAGSFCPAQRREKMVTRILALFFTGSLALAQESPVVANVVNNTDPRPVANGKSCRIREVGTRQDWLHPSELRFFSCTSYDDGALVELTLNGDTFRFEDGIHSETESFLVYRNTFSNYEFPVADGIRFHMYAIKHSQAIAESYYYYVLRHGDRFYRLSKEPIAALFYDEELGLFYSVQGWNNAKSEPVSYKEFYALDFEKHSLSKVREEYKVWTTETSSP